MPRKRKKPLRYMPLRKREKMFIHRSAALNYDRRYVIAALRGFRKKRGQRLNRRQVDKVYSQALKTKSIYAARRTTRERLVQKGYSKKGKRERLLKLMEAAQMAKSQTTLAESPESP